jgi:hypothetical protein
MSTVNEIKEKDIQNKLEIIVEYPRNNSTNNNDYVNIKYTTYFVVILYVFVCTLPFIICDLYFGFSKDPCLIEHSDNFNFKLKTYLLASGFIGIISIIIVKVFICLSLESNNTEEINAFIVFGISLQCFIGSFYIIWNILGAVLFWDYIYPNHKCNSNLSTYLCVSLIIKLLASCSFARSSKHNDDN